MSRDERKRRGRRRQPTVALVQPGAAGARVRRQAAVRARAQRTLAGGPRARTPATPPALARRAQLTVYNTHTHIQTNKHEY